MQTAVQDKLSRLRDRISGFGKVVIGFSGGIDSSLLLKVAVDTIGGENVWAVTGDSESLLPEEKEFCGKLAHEIGLVPENFVEIKTEELSDPNYRKNPVDRCYFCKSELFDKLVDYAARIGADAVFDGSNADDLSDWRPGRKAAGERGVISPLADVGITKAELREMAREFGLPNWDKPALACLSSRIPYGSEVTVEKLNRIANAERHLKSLGFSQLRVRHYDKMARIELLKDELPRLFEDDLYTRVADEFKSLGFSYVTVDLQGYRSGSMNEGLSTKGENE
ncbi:MAG: ATP-dependent sacrificial sulfur transferase LarE [candidate division Zixibacteria bacterium]